MAQLDVRAQCSATTCDLGRTNSVRFAEAILSCAISDGTLLRCQACSLPEQARAFSLEETRGANDVVAVADRPSRAVQQQASRKDRLRCGHKRAGRKQLAAHSTQEAARRNESSSGQRQGGETQQTASGPKWIRRTAPHSTAIELRTPRPSSGPHHRGDSGPPAAQRVANRRS